MAFGPPCRADTALSPGGRVWSPATAEALFEELRLLISQDALRLFRGHSDFSWLIDSKFARTVKTNTFGFQPGHGPLAVIATSPYFVQVLYGLLHLKFGVLGSPSPQLFALSDAHPGLDPWFEWMKKMQQYPQTDVPAAFAGTPLLDWSTDWRVALWFACADAGDADGAVYVWDATASGACQSTRTVRELLDHIQDHDWNRGEIPGLPMIFRPPVMTHMARAVAQRAMYVAQIDLRRSLENVFREHETRLEHRLFLKIRVVNGIKQQVLALLRESGIDQAAMYPDLQPGERI